MQIAYNKSHILLLDAVQKRAKKNIPRIAFNIAFHYAKVLSSCERLH